MPTIYKDAETGKVIKSPADSTRAKAQAAAEGKPVAEKKPETPPQLSQG